VPVVNEFPDVLSEELPGMPLDRDIKFVIDLMPSTTPIYKSPYMIATPELAELKEHIKDLLEKCFIHPSSSSWGAPVIFVLKKCHIPKFSFRNVNHFSHKKLKISKKNSFILT
jgi:hypothetical protein